MIDIELSKKIRGWMSADELMWLAQQASQCELIVEVGTFVGRSARAISDNSPGLVYCVDSYDPTRPGFSRQPPSSEPRFNRALETYEDGTRMYEEAKWNLRDLIVTGRLVLLRKNSIEGFTWLVQNVGADKFDMAFLDGDHGYETVRYEIEMYSQLLKPNGLLVGHDYYDGGRLHQGVKQAVDEAFGPNLTRPCGSLWVGSL